MARKNDKNDSSEKDLNKMKKRDLLEIMLAQSREIDSLRQQVQTLQEQLEDKEIKIANAGSIAEASLSLTKVFREAQKAANLYLTNIRRMAAEQQPSSSQNPAEEEQAQTDGQAGAGGNEQ